MYYYESPTTDPYENLAIEEHLFETLPAGAGLFILWQNSDAVIVGKYQNTAEEIHAAYVREHGVAVVRRMSGGGAVYHDLGGLNYPLILDEESPDDADQNAVWQQCMAPLLAVLRSYGLDAQFSGRNDILVRMVMAPRTAGARSPAVPSTAAAAGRSITAAFCLIQIWKRSRQRLPPARPSSCPAATSRWRPGSRPSGHVWMDCARRIREQRRKLRKR